MVEIKMTIKKQNLKIQRVYNLKLKQKKLTEFKQYKQFFRKINDKKRQDKDELYDRLFSYGNIGCKMCNNYENCEKKYRNKQKAGCYIG